MYVRIRNLREDNDLSQENLAKYLNCTQQSYSKYESGLRRMPNEVLIKLAILYDVSIDYIVGNTDVKKPYPRKK